MTRPRSPNPRLTPLQGRIVWGLAVDCCCDELPEIYRYAREATLETDPRDALPAFWRELRILLDGGWLELSREAASTPRGPRPDPILAAEIPVDPATAGWWTWDAHAGDWSPSSATGVWVKLTRAGTRDLAPRPAGEA